MTIPFWGFTVLNDVGNFVDRILENLYLTQFFTGYQWMDWVIGFTVFMGVISGIRRGLMRELGVILELVFVTYLTLEYYKSLQDLVETYLRFLPESWGVPISYLLWGLIVWSAFFLIDRLLAKRIHAKASPLLQVLGGIFLGPLRLLLIFSLTVQWILLMPFDIIHPAFQEGNSRMGYFTARLAPRIHSILEQPLKNVEKDFKK